MSDGFLAQEIHDKAMAFRVKNPDLAALLFEAEKRLHKKAEAPERAQRLAKNLQQFIDFLASLPTGWLGKTVADVGLLNTAYIEARKLGVKIR